MDQFNHNIIEQDIKRLSQEIAEKRNLAEYKELSEKELIKQTLEPIIKPAASGQQQPPAIVKASATDEQAILPDYLKDSPNEIKIQVEKLVDAVFHQGINKTIKEAQKAGPFILDAFHDALTDKLYEELKTRKYL